MQGYITLLAALKIFGYNFDENNPPDRDTLIMLALSELLKK